ncbi:peptidase inhibitor family I36 protein [Pseudomonas azerbaijanoccidens]|uniref:peptidase inhibitor family I36 protein n=1 Tax=Pseudomonas azerbaijanoccidentalis TaxID=2842347 RepID=UPI00200B2711|nr:peptidase inhibitor family I36 protein [Pseudomonas azerbaijanoccidentalis]MCK8668981.1 peptidase inhibitor family I36 protein [Pseudomonas azerbaijanoccidentalis]
MKTKGLTIVVVVCVLVGAGFYFYSGKNPNAQSAYSLFDPTLTDEQKSVVQPQIDQQLARAPGGKQVSSTQVVYDKGAIVITYPVPGVANERLTTCDYRHFCVWENNDYQGQKVSLEVLPSGTVNLPVYMTRQVSSWKYNNERYRTVVYGVDGANAVGRIMTSTLKEIGIGDECCPFRADDQKQSWTEIYELRALGSTTDTIVSIRFSPMFGTPAK